MSQPVIYVPGFPGSHLRTHPEGKRIFLKILAMLPRPTEELLRQLTGPDDLTRLDGVVTGPPIRGGKKILFFDLPKQAESLYEILRGLGIDPVKFGWDWRRPVWDPLASHGAQARLEAEIRRQAPGNRKVTVIAHSTGGLVVRHLLEEKARQGDTAFVRKVSRIIAFGVPWAGTLKPMRFLLGRRGFHTIGRRRAQRVIAGSWTSFDLLPPDPRKTPMLDAAGRPLGLVLDGSGRQVSPLVKRDWFDPGLRPGMELRADGADARLGTRTPELRLGGVRIPVTNVAGWGVRTTTHAVITGSGTNQKVSLHQGHNGDKTVPYRSAWWLRGADVTSYHLPVGFYPGNKTNFHTSIWGNPGGRNLLRHLLGGAPLEPFVYAAVDVEDGRSPNKAHVRVRLSTLDAAGGPLPNVRVTVRLRNNPRPVHDFTPKDGRHTFTVPRARMARVGNSGFRTFSIVIEAAGQTFRPRRYFVRA